MGPSSNSHSGVEDHDSGAQQSTGCKAQGKSVMKTKLGGSEIIKCKDDLFFSLVDGSDNY
ncbi:hypothetical protein MYCTH_2311121 [Thermothelomyces thermophilus ATCC 42464]|uniref:Uncharacterized protein n=1 Tax=Thermothelomyces thermophilus (strain ATCC 42464 / BCRC 31852 / DSM 1799) TaxID=573729 RepID=G2QML0_THET4|nr:uncharacterized protein MYCTH_2311121 [Thermothelomyces thermophilus ATCC 42464]AEO61190.1 hypothetical protein MYCTH_2311121 [Thermothelomyces thermophilus ATCC 42464]